jgi:hypothetical protein
MPFILSHRCPSSHHIFHSPPHHDDPSKRASAVDADDRYVYRPLSFILSIDLLLLMPPKTTALPMEALEPPLHETSLTAQGIRALFRNPDWHSLISRNQQIVFLFDFARSNCGIGLSNQVLARVFNISPSQVAKVRSKAQNSQHPPH